MTLYTKYSPGDEVWVMVYNKPQKYIIDKVEVSASRAFNYMPQYTMAYSGLNSPKFTEDKLFKTKQELLESL